MCVSDADFCQRNRARYISQELCSAVFTRYECGCYVIHRTKKLLCSDSDILADSQTMTAEGETYKAGKITFTLSLSL